MRRMDEQYLATPFYGSRRMTATLRLAAHRVNRKRGQWLMRLKGLEALEPKPQHQPPFSAASRLLPTCCAPNQVWAAGITYIPMAATFSIWSL